MNPSSTVHVNSQQHKQKQRLLSQFLNPYNADSGSSLVLYEKDLQQIFKQKHQMQTILQGTPKYQLRRMFQTKRQEQQIQDVLQRSSLRTLKYLKQGVEVFNKIFMEYFSLYLGMYLGYNTDKIKEKIKYNEIPTQREKKLFQILLMLMELDEDHKKAFLSMFSKLNMTFVRKFRPIFLNDWLKENVNDAILADMVYEVFDKSSLFNNYLQNLDDIKKEPKQDLYIKMTNEIMNILNNSDSTLQLYQTKSGRKQRQGAIDYGRQSTIPVELEPSTRQQNQKNVSFTDNDMEIDELSHQIQKHGISHVNDFSSFK